MDSKKAILILFVIMVVVQWMVPAIMIFENERVIHKGETFKFKITPIDPNDPFRGKYVILQFEERMYGNLEQGVSLDKGDEIYVSLTSDADGYAEIVSVSTEEIHDGNPYVLASVDYFSGGMLFIEYPFNRYYMDETKAYDAELLINDTEQVAYALVYVENGNAVLSDVMINEISLKDLVGEE